MRCVRKSSHRQLRSIEIGRTAWQSVAHSSETRQTKRNDTLIIRCEQKNQSNANEHVRFEFSKSGRKYIKTRNRKLSIMIRLKLAKWLRNFFRLKWCIKYGAWFVSLWMPTGNFSSNPKEKVVDWYIFQSIVRFPKHFKRVFVCVFFFSPAFTFCLSWQIEQKPSLGMGKKQDDGKSDKMSGWVWWRTHGLNTLSVKVTHKKWGKSIDSNRNMRWTKIRLCSTRVLLEWRPSKWVCRCSRREMLFRQNSLENHEDYD